MFFSEKCVWIVALEPGGLNADPIDFVEHFEQVTGGHGDADAAWM